MSHCPICGDDWAKAQFLDNTLLAVPTLDALTREVARTGQAALRMARSALTGADVAALNADKTILLRLASPVHRFVDRLRSASMSQPPAPGWPICCAYSVVTKRRRSRPWTPPHCRR